MKIEPCVFTDEVAAEFEEAVRLSAEAGATGLEIRGKLFGKSVTGITDDEVGQVQAIMERYGAHVAAIGSPFGKCSMDDPAEMEQHQRHFERMVQLAHIFGTPIIRGFALWNPNRGRELPRPDINAYVERIVKFLRPAVQLAERENVILCLENEGATLVGTCAEARIVFDALVDSPALAVAWDVNNGWGCGEMPLPDGYSQVRGKVRHLHVKPNRDKSMATVSSTPITYEQVLRTLLADGYSGAASIEHWGSPDLMLKGIRELVATLRRL